LINFAETAGALQSCGDSAGDVVLDIALYLQGSSAYADATCVPAGAFANYSGDVTLGDLPKLVMVEDSAFDRLKGTLTINGQWASLKDINTNAFAGNRDANVSFAGTRALSSLRRVETGAFENFDGFLHIDAITPHLIWVGDNAFHNAGRQTCQVGNNVSCFPTGVWDEADPNYIMFPAT